MYKSAGLLFLASALVGGIIGLSSDAAATWRGVDASACRPYYEGDYANFSGNGNLSTNSTPIVCPVVDGSDIPKTNASLDVDIDQNNPNTATGAQACYNSESGSGGSCSSTVYTSGTGLKHISVTTSWPSTDYGYVAVSLAPIYSSSTSKIKGYWWSI